jgi:rhodanese-related sulfurtransferase
MSDPLTTDCTVTELSAKLANGDDFILLDVRMEEELEIAKIGEPTHIVLQELPDRLDELEAAREREIVVMCHHGGRSAMARDFLLDNGFTHVRNLAGGIDAYADAVDHDMPRY